ncbi:TPA: hypothetical protein N0F65_009397 [Lagenidium giganteum]|uniref:procollagen-lysine 5-dioxygenase n=1 Tax=Lagenidium giganteum TaxID=4803 RepID=A0AAV2ZDI9_9STRA|nr:TPA: hypothetical protein N0F65_009397 [Lagenidium giganteum]
MATNKQAARTMPTNSLLNVLSPQLQALVEASLGEKIPTANGSAVITPVKPPVAQKSVPEQAVEDVRRQRSTGVVIASNDRPLNPSEVFVLRHKESPGVIARHSFLGRDRALAALDALERLAKEEEFHRAGVGHGNQRREQPSVRGDSIHWIQRDKAAQPLDPAITTLFRRVEALVFGLTKSAPEIGLRNITSTQFAIFPGDGSRFVRHTDTYSSAHQQVQTASGDSLIRRITCVYYLNKDWQPADAGQLRVYMNGMAASAGEYWDVAPGLDTLLVFRSTDVEHEVLPTFKDRKAITIWYYGKPLEDEKAPTSAIPAQIPELRSETNSIFVTIPSYRDSECQPTIEDLFRKARNASSVFVGLCLQSEQDDPLRQTLEANYPRVRVKWMHYRDAAGPCVARAEAQKLWRGEKYYLQIDSHMRFQEGWDTFLINELARCTSLKPILTTYPQGYTLPNNAPATPRPTLLCASQFDEHGMLRQSSKTLLSKPSGPVPSLFWAAGFAFSSSKVIEEVPYDKSLRFLFFGEEASMSARLWTNGWDFFAPSEMIIFHLWSREHRPVFQELESEQSRLEKEEASRSVIRLISGESKSDRFGLGCDRTIDEYQEHVGINYERHEVSWRAQWGNADPIQFDLSSKPPQ